MNILENRSQKATCLTYVLVALVVALAVPATVFAAATKNPMHTASKSSSGHKKTVVSKPSKKVLAKVPAKTKQALKSPPKKPAQAKVKPQHLNADSNRVRAVIGKNSQGTFAVLRQTDAKKSSFTSSKVAVGNVSAASQMDQSSRLSAGERLGLRASEDALDLSSSVALVVDQDTNEVLFSKNDSAVLPIASLTKLMTGLVIADANLPMDEAITITQDDVDVYKGSRSRLAVGTTLSRGELMHLALMSSENRAAHALGRTFPGGLQHFVSLMNSKARELGMNDTRYVEPTGLLSQNQSSARDLATLVSVAYERPILRDLSTSPSHQLELGRRTLQFNNSNRLIRNPEWDIGLQKTGYIAEAGRCLVMQAKVAGRKVIMVFLDSAGKLSRVQDAERVRRWVEGQPHRPVFVRPQG
ncbi:MAG: serine hydrolase [Hydrogenophaga sp.]|nr:serine hydrolase [Hydrogenophaga sp.]